MAGPLADGAARFGAGCWANQTWEHCCAAKSEYGTGHGSCFGSLHRYKACCEPSQVPRDIFRCQDRGKVWSELRTGIIYARVFHELPDSESLRWRAGECFIGALMASLVFLAYAGAKRSSEKILQQGWHLAEELFSILLRSPITIDELLLSGWHLGAILLFLRTLPSVEQIAGPWAPEPSVASEFVLLRQLEALPMAASIRVQQDLTFELMDDPKSISRELAYVISTWSAAYGALLELWRHSWAEVGEMVKLLRRGEAKLKDVIQGTSPLKQLLQPPPFLLHLLQALHLYPVVQADVSATLELYPPFFHRASPHTWRGSRHRRSIPPLELHPMPMDDGLSNANRATRLPFCFEPMYYSTFALLSQWQLSAELTSPEARDAPPFLRVWEIGANMGDCSLLALHLVSSWGSSTQPRPLVTLEATLFEPIADAVVSANAAVSAFLQRQRAQTTKLPQIFVRPLALGPKVSPKEINLRRGSTAEASFLGCHGFQGECEVQQVWMETLDHLLQGGDVVDIIKIHVQGSELEVLRGAQESLSEGRICLVHVMSSAVRIGQFAEVSTEQVIRSFMEIFRHHHAVASDGIHVMPLAAVPARLQKDRNYFVTAWHEGPLCRDRPSIQAAQHLWGHVLAPADAEMRKKKSWRINKPSPFGVKTLFIWGVE
ncbi:unnamed protein product [Durusdinium trenchii]|uniref:Methyltransferase FkbM domain-containing protein n=1 Tax=Durusdinium trenchii TaxID=1381693 RepID=A0ABP0N927_9DINO